MFNTPFDPNDAMHVRMQKDFRAATMNRMPAGARTLYESRREEFLRNTSKKPVARKALGGEPLAPLGTPKRGFQERELRNAIQTAEVIDRANLRQHGFNDMADFLRTVRHSSAPQMKGRPDPRLIQNSAPGTFGTEGVGADGGFAVPPQFLGEIIRKFIATDSLLLQTDARTTQTNSLNIPKDETAPWQTSGGVQAFWDDEAGQKTQSKPSLKNSTLKLGKIIALVPITDELADDSNALVEHISSRAPDAIAFAVEQAILSGSGTGRPLGIINSGATISVAEESGQTAATINNFNVMKMWNRTIASARRNGTWLVHPDADLQLQQLVHPGNAGDVAAAAPMYAPPSPFAPNGSLLGRPIYFSEACSSLGTVGDIAFGDLSAYLTATKMLRSDVSIHLWFDYDVSAYRFVLRMGGQPFASAPTPSLNGGTTRSFFTTLATRS